MIVNLLLTKYSARAREVKALFKIITIFPSVNLVSRMFFQRLDVSEAKKLSGKTVNGQKKAQKKPEAR
jgi:hypothetical protein